MDYQRLRLNEFKELYREAGKLLPPWGRFLILGLLVWVENHVIEYRAKAAVDAAIEEYEQIEPPEVSLPPPVYSESGDNFFDEMRLRAPWVPLDNPSDSP